MNSLAFSLLLLVASASAIGNGPYVLPAGFREVLRGARAFVENFNCDDRPYGYYADVDNDCQIFHVCVPVLDDAGALVETNRFSFICGNSTIFSQDTLTCVGDAEALPCQDAPSVFESANALFGNLLSNFTVNTPDGSTFIDRVRNVAAARLQAQGINAGFENQNQNIGFDTQNQNTRFDTQNQNTRFDTQNQNTRFDTQNQNTRFDTQNQNTGFDNQNQDTRFNNQDQIGGFIDPNSGITNVLGDNNQAGGFSGFSDANEDVQFS